MKKVLCKKNFIGGNGTGSLEFIKNNYYNSEKIIKTKHILIYDYKNHNTHYFTYNVFANYFYTDQEIRKLKLKKINNG
jgi:hypothetical protein